MYYSSSADPDNSYCQMEERIICPVCLKETVYTIKNREFVSLFTCDHCGFKTTDIKSFTINSSQTVQTAQQYTPDFNRMFFDSIHKQFVCPKCGNRNIHVKSGMFSDLYICEKCGHEARTIEDIPSYMIETK